MTHHFFNESLQQTPVRIANTQTFASIMLDKNEQSNDVDVELKTRVMDKLLHADWNRYPSACNADIENKIAGYCHLNKENIVLSGGSATMITALLNYFALNGKTITIVQPSYSLFEYHCNTYNIAYTPWMLTADLEFDYDHMPMLDKHSVLIITSPNNPTGNAIDTNQLQELLHKHPESLIILDGVYTEFCAEDVTSLIHSHPNLIVLRSFSKAFPVAGLRLGYLCAAPGIASVVRKLILQFSITPFSLIFAREILFDKEFMRSSQQRVQDIIRQRENVSNTIARLFSGEILTVFPSQGNFLLIRIHDDTYFNNLMEDLAEAGIKVLNTSSFLLLENTFRVSVGTTSENNVFLTCLQNSLESNDYNTGLLIENNTLQVA